MSIKLIAVDMDGTFLSDQKTYNRERFMAQYQQMKAQGIRFVVASGNQYYQLISFFPEIANEIESDWAKKSIQNIIRKLESKNAIEIAEITKIGKTYGRLFRPTVSSDEYAMEQFNRFYDKDDYAPFLLSALVDTKEENKELAQKLRDLIDQYKEE